MAATACCRTVHAPIILGLIGCSIKVPAETVLHHVQRLDDGSFVVQLVLQPGTFQQGLNLHYAKKIVTPSISGMQKNIAVGSLSNISYLKAICL
jgi:hypothetical protein